jgi:hypothetical protein
VRGNGKSILAGAEPGTRACGYLTAQQFVLLQTTPDWSWDPISDDWQTQYASAVTYFNNNGHWPTTNDSNTQIRKLGRWVATNRKQGRRFSAGAPSDMTADRFAQLGSTAGWSWDLFADAWDQNFGAVRMFRTKHKRWPAFGASGEEGVLARWVGTQRNAWKQSKISSERVERLESIPGWTWPAMS